MGMSRDHCSTLCLILVMIHVHIIRVRSIRCKELVCSEAQIEWQILWYPILLKIFGIWIYCGVDSDQEYLEKLVEQIMGKLGSQYSENFSFRTMLLSKPNSVHGTWGHIDVSCCCCMQSGGLCKCDMSQPHQEHDACKQSISRASDHCTRGRYNCC